MSLDECEGCAACRLSEMTGRPHEEFEPDAEIPDLEEQDPYVTDGGAESERNVHRCPECNTPIVSAEPLSAESRTRLNPCNHIVKVGGHHE